jgi:hypothetical protein
MSNSRERSSAPAAVLGIGTPGCRPLSPPCTNQSFIYGRPTSRTTWDVTIKSFPRWTGTSVLLRTAHAAEVNDPG